MAEILANYVQTTVIAGPGVDSGDTTITVDDSSEFPPTGNFRLAVDQEIMLCTDNTSNVFTVARGQEGTVPAAHAPASIVALVLTAGAIVQYVSEH